MGACFCLVVEETVESNSSENQTQNQIFLPKTCHFRTAAVGSTAQTEVRIYFIYHQ